MLENPLPHKKTVFVCCNRRTAEGARICCASQNGEAIHAQLKEIIKRRGYRTKIRICKSGCMDRCELGANIMIAPDNLWLSGVEQRDVEAIADRLINEVEALDIEQPLANA